MRSDVFLGVQLRIGPLVCRRFCGFAAQLCAFSKARISCAPAIRLHSRSSTARDSPNAILRSLTLVAAARAPIRRDRRASIRASLFAHSASTQFNSAAPPSISFSRRPFDDNADRVASSLLHSKPPPPPPPPSSRARAHGYRQFPARRLFLHDAQSLYTSISAALPARQH